VDTDISETIVRDVADPQSSTTGVRHRRTWSGLKFAVRGANPDRKKAAAKPAARRPTEMSGLELATPRLLLVPVTSAPSTRKSPTARAWVGSSAPTFLPAGLRPSTPGHDALDAQEPHRQPGQPRLGTWYFLLRRDSRTPELIGNGGWGSSWPRPRAKSASP
jgi:hypothetical protein